MTDRELLELAAKAAGIVLFDGGPDVRVPDECQARVWDRDDQLTILFYSDAGNNPLCKRVRRSGNVEWNPLTDDGDAFRLAVKVGIDIIVCLNPARSAACSPEIDADYLEEKHGADPNAATRRAIVRAAAQIAHSLNGSPARQGARPSDPDLNPDLSASASPATKEQQ